MTDIADDLLTDALAPISRRAVAQVIDSLLVLLPALPVALALGAIGGDGLDDDELLLVTVVQVAVAVAYETVAVALFARTIGKRALGIMVVRSEDGGRVGWAYSLVRSLVPAAASLVPVVGPGLSIVVYMRAFFHPLRQGLHDAAAGTVVVMAR